MGRDKIYHLGCSGYFYKGWWGRFYPKELKMSQWFSYYATKFNTVEINATFYRIPKPSDIKRWYKQAPEGFLFSVKMPRTITHYKKFRDTEKETKDFYNLVKDNLREKLACMLIQLPPSYKASAENLDIILDQIDPEVKNVIEFRHKSWWNEETYKKMREKGVCFCSVSAPNLPEDLIVTTDFAYIRFHGKEGWYKYDYSDEELKEWALKIKQAECKEIFAYFNNDFNANAPRNCEKLKYFLQ